ncbi:MAG: glycosyltransferase family 39 protein [Candidatus Acidiferrum sp.]
MTNTELVSSRAMNGAQTNESSHESPLSRWVFIVAAIYFLLHLLTATRYGYFRDALYYLACSEHLDWGYVDQPPLIAALGWVARHTLGTSLPALLFWPALAGTARIVLTVAFARELGAGRFGTVLAAVLSVTPPVWYVIDHQFAMNAVEPIFWTGCAFVILLMIKTGNSRLWLAFGAIAGLGLQNKYSIAVFAFGLLAGLLLSPHRKLLLTPWLFAGGSVALLIFLPNLLWNMHHHRPFLELMHNIRASGKDVVLSPLAFLAQQILVMGPVSFPFWLAGLLFYLLSPNARHFRTFGWAFVITIAFFLMAHGKNY